MLCRQFRVVIDRALHRQTTTTMCQPMHTLGFLIVMADVNVPVVARGAWFGHPENVAACACDPRLKEVAMVDSPFITNAITRNSENKLDRRRFLRAPVPVAPAAVGTPSCRSAVPSPQRVQWLGPTSTAAQPCQTVSPRTSSTPTGLHHTNAQEVSSTR